MLHAEELLDTVVAALPFLCGQQHEHHQHSPLDNPAVRVRLHILGNARISNVGKSQSCMVSKVPSICQQTVLLDPEAKGKSSGSSAQGRIASPAANVRNLDQMASQLFDAADLDASAPRLRVRFHIIRNLETMHD